MQENKEKWMKLCEQAAGEHGNEFSIRTHQSLPFLPGAHSLFE
jgi:hypothetical protein